MTDIESLAREEAERLLPCDKGCGEVLNGYPMLNGQHFVDCQASNVPAAVAALAYRMRAACWAEETPSYQSRVAPWMQACFGPEISADQVERGDRLVEEVFELLQSMGYDPARIVPLRDYVWSRDVGEPSQEVGGVMITLAAFCLATGLDMHAAGETELARIWTKVEAIRAKQAAKPKHSPLPAAPARFGPNVTLLPSSILAACDAEAKLWAKEINLTGWIAQMSKDPRTREKLDVILRQCFVEGVYRGALNVIHGKSLADSIAQARETP